MGARIIDLAQVRAQKSQPNSEIEHSHARIQTSENRFHFWSGASGQRYVHTIYSLIECPEMPAGNYVLVRRTAEGRRIALAVGRATHAAASLNLAEIRQRGAQLGANEVHVHLLAENKSQSKLIEFDLRSGQLQPLSPTTHVLH